jgi:hypothetical protein
MSVLGTVHVGAPPNKNPLHSFFTLFRDRATKSDSGEDDDQYDDDDQDTSARVSKPSHAGAVTLASKCALALGKRGNKPRTVAHNLMIVFPEMHFYTKEFGGNIAASPGVELTNDVELYRTVGAMEALFSLMYNDHKMIAKTDAKGKINVTTEDYKHMSQKFLDECDILAMDGDDRNAAFYLLAIHDIGKSEYFRDLVNSQLEESEQSDNHDTVLGHALRILLDPEAKGFAELSEAMPTMREFIAPEWKKQLTCAFESDFHLPQVMQGEASVLAFDGLFDAKRNGLTRPGCALYLYHSLFDVAGTPCSEASITPNVIPILYTTWPVYMHKIIERLYPTGEAHTVTGQQLYRSLLRDAAVSQRHEGINAAIGAGNDSDDEFALLRILAMSRWQFANSVQLKKVLMYDQFETLRSELAGKAVGPQIMMYYIPDLVQKTLFRDADMKTRVEQTIEVESYEELLDTLSALFAFVRGELADDARKITVEVNVVELCNLMKNAMANYEAKIADKQDWNSALPVVPGGPDAFLSARTLKRIYDAHEPSLKWNTFKTEAKLIMKVKAPEPKV